MLQGDVASILLYSEKSVKCPKFRSGVPILMGERRYSNLRWFFVIFPIYDSILGMMSVGSDKFRHQ